MKIYEQTFYRFDGCDFSTLAEVEKEIENRIGKIIDKVPATLGPRERLAILDTIYANRVELSALLSIELEDKK